MCIRDSLSSLSNRKYLEYISYFQSDDQVRGSDDQVRGLKALIGYFNIVMCNSGISVCGYLLTWNLWTGRRIVLYLTNVKLDAAK